MQIERVKGDDYADEFTLTLKKTLKPANLAGCSAILILDKVQSPVDNSTQVYQLVGRIDDPMSGKVMFAPSKAQADLHGRFYFTVKLTDQTGIDRTIASGVYIYK